MSPASPPALFLDRDGTIVVEKEYLRDLAELELLPGAGAAIARANRAGCPVIVVTNQSGVARGYFDEAFVRRSAERLAGLLRAEGAHFDGFYYSPHHPEGRPPYDRPDGRRKPAAGMLLEAAREHGLTLRGAFLVGDQASDLATGADLGVIPVLVRTGYGRETERNLQPAFHERGGHVCDDLAAAVDWILAQGSVAR